MGKLHTAAGTCWTCQPVMTGIEKITFHGWQTRLGWFQYSGKFLFFSGQMVKESNRLGFADESTIELGESTGNCSVFVSMVPHYEQCGHPPFGGSTLLCEL